MYRLDLHQGPGPMGVTVPRSPTVAAAGPASEFDEFTVVLRGTLMVEHEGGSLEVTSGQAVHTRPGEWVRYATPGPDGAEYVAVCLPAFSPETVHRDT